MKKRSSFNVMARLIGLVKPLAPVMIIAIAMGSFGYFCASFITVFGAYAVIDIIENSGVNTMLFIKVIAVIAVLRGVLHYIEQYCNHFIAFKLLALIRDKVFTALRKLAPAKLDGKDKGNLVSIITSDIELLEVFYAHTVSPICIAFITSAVVICFIGSFNVLLGVIALLAHLSVGVIIPITVSKKSKQSGESHRERVGGLNTYFLDSLRGLKEILQFNYITERKEKIAELSEQIESSNKEIKKHIGRTYSLTNFVILTFSAIMLFSSAYLYTSNIINLTSVIVPTIMLFSSFGAVTSVANLGAGLSGTIASGNRVLDILDDTPIVSEVENGKDICFNGANFNNVNFAYKGNGGENILDNFSLNIEKNKILAICGKSGCGKSTALKLLMRFYDVQSGDVLISSENIKNINTQSLRDNESFVTQQTHIFHDTIENNIKIANVNASREEVITAAKSASLHEFIMSLPNGYDTEVGELGDTISGGEKQRIGIARAFLHGANLILLDEPTSNLDSLNEAVILKSLKECSDKTVVLVSHRKSTLKIAHAVLNMETTRQS